MIGGPQGRPRNRRRVARLVSERVALRNTTPGLEARPLADESTRTGVLRMVAEDRKHVARLVLEKRTERLQSLGIEPSGEEFRYHAVVMGKELAADFPQNVEGVALRCTCIPNPVRGLTQIVAAAAPGGPAVRPLRPGLAIQNSDWAGSSRASGKRFLGTLGCFVRLADKRIALVTARHAVFAPEGDLVDGRPNRLVQPEGEEPRPTIATLTTVVPMTRPLAAGAARDHVIGEVDLAIAALEPGVEFDSRATGALASSVRSIGMPEPGRTVWKAGSATGLTQGKITSVDHEVRVQIGDRQYWFDGAAPVEGEDGKAFAGPGDAGAVIVDQAGEVMGMVFAGADRLAYAFPLRGALERLGCSLKPTDAPPPSPPPERLKPDEILARMEVRGYPGVYLLGRNARRLTFLSQQNRAEPDLALNRTKLPQRPGWSGRQSGRHRWGTRGTDRRAGSQLAPRGRDADGAYDRAPASPERLPVPVRPPEHLRLARGTVDRRRDRPPVHELGADMAASVSESILRQWEALAGPVRKLKQALVSRIERAPTAGP